MELNKYVYFYNSLYNKFKDSNFRYDGNKINSLWVKNIMPIFFPKVLIC